MKYIGAHIDCPSDLAEAPLLASQLGATAFSIVLKDPAKWNFQVLPDGQAQAFRDACALHGFSAAQILPHAGFVVNLCSPDPRKLKLSRISLSAEMTRAAELGLTMVNFHPGAHLKQMQEAEACDLVAESLNKVLADSPGTVTAVIENTAGQGSNIGFSFAQIGRIISGIGDKSRVGVCIDTAHGFAAGYDFSTEEGYHALWDEFDREIGSRYLRGMHLNDSQRPLSSHIDRHAPIGAGTIGAAAFRRLMHDPRLDGIPLILETPDAACWQAEVAQLKAWALEYS